MDVSSASSPTLSAIPFTSWMMGSSYFMVILIATYSAYIVERAVAVCNLNSHITWNSYTVRTHTVLTLELGRY